VRGCGNRLLADAATEDPERPIERRSGVFLHFLPPFSLITHPFPSASSERIYRSSRDIFFVLIKCVFKNEPPFLQLLGIKTNKNNIKKM
jgi:hypothetical protein